MIRKLLAACGALAAAVYIGGDLLAASRYPGYQILHQAISELSAIGAPTAPLWADVGFLYGALVLAFGIGVWRSASASRALRWAGALLVFTSLMGIGWYFAPMTARGGERTTSDVLHIVMTGLTVPTLLVITVVAARAFGRGFRVYSIATVAAVLAFAVPTSLAVPRIDAGLPTPWLGVYERIMVWGWMVWMGALSVALLRRSGDAAPRAARGMETDTHVPLPAA
jgi:hypothetical protein